MDNDLKELFQPAFPGANLEIKSSTNNFYCENIGKCNVNIQEEAIWSPAFGDDNTNVMLIAEAPSVTGGKGPHTGGKFEDFGLQNLINFVKKYFNTTPHFTDLMKCGVSRQSAENKSRVFKLRKDNCFEKFLIREIEIIKPEFILCLGNSAFDAINKEILKNDSRINKSTKVIKLVHYSKQANLQLTMKDKEDIIWPIQIGKLEKDNLRYLSIFSDKSINNKKETD